LYQKTTLDSGLRIITANMPHTHSVCVGIFTGVGSRYETNQQAGISHFIEHMCFKGTQKRPTSRQISEAIEGVGGILNGGTDRELTVYWCKVSESHFPLAIDILTDTLLHSNFDPLEIEKERQVIIEEINMYKDSPAQQVNMLIDELIWPDHPLGRDIAGSVESVNTITREAMLDYVNKHYLPGNTVVAVAGNIDHQQTVTTTRQVMADWSNQQPLPRYAAYEESIAPRWRIEPKETEQAHLCLALPGLSSLNPKRFTLDLLNVILGQGMSSRLFTEIRDNMGLAYSIHSHSDHLLDSGAVTIYAGVEPKKLKTAITAILAQLALLKEPIPEAELTKARELTKGHLLLRMEDSRNVASWAGGQEALTGQILNVEDIISIVDAITTDDLQQIAEELIIASQLRLAVVGPIARGEPLNELLKF